MRKLELRFLVLALLCEVAIALFLMFVAIATLFAAAPQVRLNVAKTPGAVRPLTTTQICTIRWGRDVRHVTLAMKRTVAANYGLPWPTPFPVEMDHLIPRELGGADDVKNLWPEGWKEARTLKDPEENHYHKLVCAGTITLAAAQDHFRHWHVPSAP